MPCNSDHLEAHQSEIELSQVFQLLDELDGKAMVPAHWNGYDPRAYGYATKALLDEKTAELCRRLSSIPISTCSLEMQIWWRDHRRADQERAVREEKAAHEERIRARAMAKLDDEERKVLGL